VGGPTAHEELFREIPVGAVSAPPLQSGLKMELFYAPSNICMNLALQKNYAIMLSTSRAADDKKSRFKVYPPGKEVKKPFWTKPAQFTGQSRIK
jgi:hypothetical protein